MPAENSKLQMQLNKLSDFANNHFMKINIKKTKIFPFNFKRSLDFVPVLTIPGNSQPLEVVYSTKLLNRSNDSGLYPSSWGFSRTSSMIYISMIFDQVESESGAVRLTVT